MPKPRSTRSTTQPAAPPHLDEELKAERIQGESPAAAATAAGLGPQPRVEPLKAERIQAFVQEFPAWSILGNHRTLVREYGLPGRASALAYLQWIAALSQDTGRSARVEWSGDNRVTVLLPQRATDRLTAADLAFARALERPW